MYLVKIIILHFKCIKIIKKYLNLNEVSGDNKLTALEKDYVYVIYGNEISEKRLKIKNILSSK